MIIRKIEDVLKQPEADLVIGNVKDRWHKGLYSLTMITGLPGSGKTSTCFRCGELTALQFPNKKVNTYTIENLSDLARCAMEAKEDEINIGIVEEVSTLFPSRRAMAGTNVDLAKILDTCRKKRLILFANAPLWPSIDSHMRSMGTLYIETLKIYKQVGIVISKFFRLQTNPATGKTYTHTMLRGGRDVKRMYTKMPNLEAWKEYEIKKDKFMNNLYERILKREQKKLEKENKELGIQGPRVPVRPLLQNELRVYQLKVGEGKTLREIGLAMGLSGSRCGDIYRNALKKLNLSSTHNIKNAANTIPSRNKVNLELSDRKNLQNNEGLATKEVKNKF
jgi:hypothetical protein